MSTHDDRILLFCPTFEINGVEQIRPETRECIQAIAARRPDVDVVISKNNPYPAGEYANVLHQYRAAEVLIHERGYRALFCVEHDMWVQEDALDKLDEVDAPVVYGLYMLRHHKPVVSAFRAIKAAYPDMPLTYYPDELREAYKQDVIQVSGAGFGCTLIRRDALELIPFREADSGNPIPDMPFAQDCMRLGVKQMCRMDVRCGHYHKGAWLWPDPEEEVCEMVKVLILQDFNASDGRALRCGETVSMGEGMVADYERAGFVRRISEPAVKVVQKPPKRRKAVKADEDD